METIIAAAIRYQGKYYLGWRHCYIGIKMREDGVCPRPYPGGKDQAFITSNGRWVDREEALKIALDTGQLLPSEKKGCEYQLFSEDLWDVNGVPYHPVKNQG